eukprot:1577665-Rhodomonas_salina.1
MRRGLSRPCELVGSDSSWVWEGRVEGLASRVKGLGSRAWGLDVRVWGPELMVLRPTRVWDVSSRMRREA